MPRKCWPHCSARPWQACCCRLLLAAPAAAGKLDDIKARGKAPRRRDRKLAAVQLPRRRQRHRRLRRRPRRPGRQAPRRRRRRKSRIINAERISALQQDRVDLVAVGMTRSKKRANDIDFSYAYLDSPHMILVRKDSGIAHITQLAGRKLALVRSASVDAQAQSRGADHADRVFRHLRRRLRGAGGAARRRLSRRQDAGAVVRAEKRPRRRISRLIGDYRSAAHRGLCPEEKRAALSATSSTGRCSIWKPRARRQRFSTTWFAPLPRTFRIQPD